MTYMIDERERASRWKATTNCLPDAAREAASYVGPAGNAEKTYPFCLPAEYAAHNLLPDVRDDALALFAEHGIPWHAGVADGRPSNHLLSSQVQCANALTPMVRDPNRIVRAFGEVVDIAEVLEIEVGRFLTFEYIGPRDLLGETVLGRRRTRGTNCTSVDAAFAIARRPASASSRWSNGRTQNRIGAGRSSRPRTSYGPGATSTSTRTRPGPLTRPCRSS
jgi:hypothetical protein